MNPINGGSPPSERIEINIDVFVNFPKNAFWEILFMFIFKRRFTKAIRVIE